MREGIQGEIGRREREQPNTAGEGWRQSCLDVWSGQHRMIDYAEVLLPEAPTQTVFAEREV